MQLYSIPHGHSIAGISLAILCAGSSGFTWMLGLYCYADSISPFWHAPKKWECTISILLWIRGYSGNWWVSPCWLMMWIGMPVGILIELVLADCHWGIGDCSHESVVTSYHCLFVEFFVKLLIHPRRIIISVWRWWSTLFSTPALCLSIILWPVITQRNHPALAGLADFWMMARITKIMVFFMIISIGFPMNLDCTACMI